MSFLKELTDKGATVAWSEVAAHPNLIALGTKDAGGGSGFDDYGGELELHKLDVSQEAEDGSSAGSLLGKVKTSTRFATLAWSGMANKQVEYPYGLIAGGMGDGTVNIWDPAKLVASHPQPQVSSVQRHTGPVTGLHFNPHKSSSHLLASGGADGEIFIMSLDQPDIPNVFVPGSNPNASRHTAEVTKVAWNSQVSHIMATAAQNGSCIIWDLKQKKPWCELRDPNRASITDLAWNPDHGQHIITASGDDNNPVLKLWDLRSSTTLPLATLAGHTEGVLSVAWCPSDSSLLMSCAKDNRTLLWDLFSLKPVYELPPGAGSAVPETNQMFGGYGKTAQRRYQVSWAPHIPAVVGTCSFDRKVQLFSMNGASTSNGRAPKWLRRPAGASFAFGGRLVSFYSQKGEVQRTTQIQNVSSHGVVKILAVNEDTAFVAASRRFEEAMASKGFTGFCQEKEASATTAHERKVWQFMPVIFERNARNQLLAHLGFEENAVMRQAAAFVGASHGDQNGDRQQNGSVLECSKDNDGDNVLDDDIDPTQRKGGAPEESELAAAMDGIDLGASKEEKSGRPATFFGEGGPTGAIQATGGMPNGDPVRSKEAELVIKRSLLVGNFEAAVQCCMAAGHPADALLLASYGGADLWTNTQNHYLARETERRPFLKVMGAIVKGELGGLVSSSDLSQWQETLAILSTYASQEQFPDLCERLAARLENEAGDRKSANLCYMCAVKVPKTVEMWAEELRAANAAVNGGTDTKALQEFVEKVSVFTQESNQLPGEEVSAIFAKYAGILASEGETQTALKYVNNGNTESGAILLDRLYHASPHAVGTPAPPFPFERVRIGVSPQSVVGQAGMSANGASNASRGQGNSQVDPAGTSAAPASRGGGVEQPLPPGWTQMTDPSRGIPYYCNAATGQTQWERPTPPAQPHPQPQRQGIAAWRHQTVATTHPPAPRAQRGYVRNPHSQQPASAASFSGDSDSNAVTRVDGYSGPYNAFSGGGGGSQQQHQQQQQQPFQQQQAFQQQQQQQQQQQPFQQQQAFQQQLQPAMTPPSPATFTPGGFGGPGGGGQRLQDTHTPTYEAQAAATRPGAGHSGFHPGRSMAAPGGVAPAAPGPAPIPRNAYDYGASAPSTPIQRPLPSPMAPTATVPAAAPPATAPPSTGTAAPPSSSQGKVAEESRESHAPPSDAESQAVVSTMNSMLGALTEAPLSVPEKKMLGDVTKAAGILFAKMGRGQVERDTLAMVGDMVNALQARDVKKASGIHQGLANSAWQNHKDWLKGIKHLNTLVARRL